MKKVFVFALVCLLTVFQAHAVLNERNLAKTLGVLRAELEQTYNQEQLSLEKFKKMNQEQHTNLIMMMQQSNQIALMLYSQNEDFTLDMAYACEAATEQYHKLMHRHLPYAQVKERMKSEILRYEELIKSLQDLPPRVDIDGQLLRIPDSIKRNRGLVDTVKLALSLLDEEGMLDRAACLKYAIFLRDNYKKMLEMVVQDEEHYIHVTKRVKELYDYAMARYEKIQRNIFVNGGENYFTVLKKFKIYAVQAKRDADEKYKPLTEKSDWRGPVILGISVFMIFYILLASLLSFVVMRLVVRKRLREDRLDRHKWFPATVAFGVAVFAISIMIAKIFVKQNFIVMAIDIMIIFAWLMEVILLSLLIRLNGTQIRPGIKVYVPFLTMSFLVIAFRIILIPNNMVNLLYPPILIAFTIWQLVVLKRNLGKLPDSDIIYAVISLTAMIVSCVASWLGFVLLAVQIMIWWMILLAAIQTLTCFYDLAKRYEARFLVRKIAERKKIKVNNENETKKLHRSLQTKLEKGEYISDTWLHDFICRAMLPILAVLSVPASIYFAAGIFEMNSICIKIFLYPFIDKAGVIQLSLFKICLVLCLFFFFRYMNYVVKAFYHLFRKRRTKNSQSSSNISLANNVISIVVWGIFAISSLVILRVPSTGISIVMAGLATGLGFAMKDLLENFVYGISLMAGRLRVGDYIECDGIEGEVDSINYQSTQIVTIDGCVLAFQNSALFSKNFKNMTRNHGYVMVSIPVGVAYGVNVSQVREILKDAVKPLVKKNKAGKDYVDVKQGIQVIFDGFGDNSVNLTVRCWILAEEKINYIPMVNETVYNALNENHIEIPFPQRDVYVRHFEMPEKPKEGNEKTDRK